jgi:hypothetical protein
VSEATAGRRQAGSAVGQPTGPRATGPTLDRRRVLRLALALPAAAALVSGCSGVTARRKEPDPLVALADAARADAALAAAAVAADPGLSARIEPLRAARAEHAAALDAEVVRVGGASGAAAPTSVGPTAAPAAPPTGSAQTPGTAGTSPSASVTAPVVTLAQVRDAVAASQRGAADLVPGLPAERVGLVASVAACCAAYAEVLA